MDVQKTRSKKAAGSQETKKDEEMVGLTGKWQKKMEDGERRLESKGEAEVPEIIIVSDAVEGTPVDMDGKSRHEQVEAKLSRRGREMLNEGEETPTSKKSNSGGIRINTGLCERRKEYGA